MRITLLATGGTIACRQTPEGLVPALRAGELLEGVPHRADVEIVCRDVFSMDSSNIQPEEWSQLALAADAAMRDSDGVVVTHGTDTMGYTAAALSYMLLGQEKPVILTGSQLPLGAPLSDAEENLSCAIEAACQGVPGTYVCFHRKLIHGARAVKTRTMSFDAFDSVNQELAGVIDSGGVRFQRPVFTEEPYRCRPEVDSRVFLLKLVPGTQPDVLDFVAQAGYRGLVIEAFGLGGLHYIRRNLVEKLRMLRELGVRILVVTQCMYEKADLSIYEVGMQLLRTDVISGMDMTTEAAVTKMMWALAQEDTDALLSRSLCGEMRG
ncbi:MAG: asparaginase [Christensenellaceae bacterium]|nr:asparaginase [Christensenellaceae bacterium]